MEKPSIGSTLFRFQTFRRAESAKVRGGTSVPSIKLRKMEFVDVAATLTDAEIESIRTQRPDLHEFALKVMASRKTIGLSECSALAEGVVPMGLAVNDKIWTGLLAAIQKNKLEVAEYAMALLYGDFVLESVLSDTPEPLFKKVLKARIVMPESLFAQVEEDAPEAEEKGLSVATQQQFGKLKEVMESEIAKERLDGLLKDVLTLEKKYLKMLKNTQIVVTPILQLVDANGDLISPDGNGNFVNADGDPITLNAEGVYTDANNVVYQVAIPPAPPSPQKPYDYLMEKLSETSKDVFEDFEFGVYDTFEDVKKEISEAILEHKKVIGSVSPAQKVLLNYKGVLFSANKNPNMDTYAYKICPVVYKGTLQFTMVVVLNTGEQVSTVDYKLSNGNGPISSRTTAGIRFNGDDTTSLTLFQPAIGLPSGGGLQLEIRITTNQRKTYFASANVSTAECVTGVVKNLEPVEPPVIPGITNLGIAEYRKVEQTVCCYVPGEVSTIENIMAREYKERSTRFMRRQETTVTSEKTTETEKMKDTVTTERHELNQEISNLEQESKDFSASAGVNFGDGKLWSANANASFAYHTSSEQSNNTALTDAKEVTEKALDRIVNKVREERIQKVMEEFEENNKHGFDNRQGAEHISGVYRWVDKIMKNEIHNYGKRLTFEFMIPEPSRLQRHFLADIKVDRSEIVEPATLWPGSIAEDSYLGLAERYGAEVSPPPPLKRVISKHFKYEKPVGNAESDNPNEKFSASEVLVIPKGYYTSYLQKATWTGVHDNDNTQRHLIGMTVGDRSFSLGAFNIPVSAPTLTTTPFWWLMPQSALAPPSIDFNRCDFDTTLWEAVPNVPRTMRPVLNNIGRFEEELQVSVFSFNMLVSNFSISVEITRTQEAYDAWLNETQMAIGAAYEAKLQEYRDKIAAANMQEKREKTANPGFYRDIEKMILKKNCMDYLLRKTDWKLGEYNFLNGGLVQDHEVRTTEASNNNIKLDQYGALVKFMEQAFEWNIMGYQFYPYYWANKGRWTELTDFTCDDMLFTKFMQSGMARVILTVRPGFEDAVN